MRYPTGIAIHQWPRDTIERGSVIREILIAPPGYTLVEWDFSGQEMRWMAEESGDPTMRQIFLSPSPYDDAHGYMGARLSGRTFENLISDLQQPKTSEIFKAGKNDRYLGKFANLSLQYRTGAPKLMSKARIEYKIPMLLFEAKRVKSTYEQTFPGVKAYWARQIHTARTQGYVETKAGKRYRFPENAWERARRWSSESTAINFPIQGVGANQKSLAMKYLRPQLDIFHGEFAWDLHDGLFAFIPDRLAVEAAYVIKEVLSNLPYKDEWGYEPEIPFPVDAALGPNWGEMEELKDVA